MFIRKMRDKNGEAIQNLNKEEKKRLLRLKGGCWVPGYSTYTTLRYSSGKPLGHITFSSVLTDVLVRHILCLLQVSLRLGLEKPQTFMKISMSFPKTPAETNLSLKSNS